MTRSSQTPDAAPEDYIHFSNAVRLGSALATLDKGQNKPWADIEPEAKMEWEKTSDRPWAEFSEIVRQTWQEVAAQFSEGVKPAQEGPTYEEMFRRHYETHYAGSQYSYRQYAPAYHYGYDLGVDRRLQDKSWTEVEPEARVYWDAQDYAGFWDDFKEATHFGWDQARGQTSLTERSDRGPAPSAG